MTGRLKRSLLVMAVTALAACQTDAAAPDDAVPQGEWRLVAISGESYAGPATLAITEDGQIAGRGPCNRYFATLTSVPPGFVVGPIGATKMACPDLQIETEFFQALTDVTVAEVEGTTLTLSGPNGVLLVFTSDG